MAEAKKPTKKIIDIQHPSKTSPSSTSKSVIVTNRPIMKDPMVVDDDSPAEEKTTAPVYKSGGEAVIKPLSEQTDKPETKEEPASDENKSKEVSDDKNKTISQLAEEATKKEQVVDEPEEAKVEDKEDKSDETDKPAIKATLTDEKSEPIVTEDKAEESKEDKKPEDVPSLTKDDSEKEDSAKTEDPKALEEAKEDKELKKRKAEVAKLSESHKYYLPITTVENRNNRRAVVIGVIVSILLILAWINIALDAGLISLGGVKAFTNFF